MNGVLAIPPVTLSPRERMTSVLDALALGLTPPFSCSACVHSLADRCPECAENLARIAVVVAAGDAVLTAPTEAAALAAYTDCMFGLVDAEVAK